MGIRLHKNTTLILIGGTFAYGLCSFLAVSGGYFGILPSSKYALLFVTPLLIAIQMATMFILNRFDKLDFARATSFRTGYKQVFFSLVLTSFVYWYLLIMVVEQNQGNDEFYDEMFLQMARSTLISSILNQLVIGVITTLFAKFLSRKFFKVKEQESDLLDDVLD